MSVLSLKSSFVYKIEYIVRHALPLAFFAFLYLLIAQAAFAADLTIAPSTGSYAVGANFTATLQADPAGDSINAVEAKLSFDPTKLAVVSVSKTGSVFSLWTTEPTFSNTDGTISFGGGSPTPFSARSTLLSVTFKTLAEGTASVSYDTASALAADGKGTDVLKNKSGGTYTVTKAAAPVTPPADTTPTQTPADSKSTTTDSGAIAFGDPPRAPEVGSVVFLDPDTWYNKTSGSFTWDIPFDVNEMAIEIATSSDNVPKHSVKPPVGEFAITPDIITDGVQYLSIRFKNQVGWGAVTNRKLQIDTTAPEDFQIKVQAGTTPTSFPLLVFNATDVTSGIDHYELVIAGGDPIVVTPDEAKLGYLVKDLEDGTYTVKVTAFDKAGNSTVSTTAMLITAGWTKPSDVKEKSTFWSLVTPSNILITILILIILMLSGYIFYERKQSTKKEEKLRKETREIQDQMEKIFSALRDEIYDQVNNITKRPRLSTKEKEAVEGLNQALEVSETLIEKEISDVQKILK